MEPIFLNKKLHKYTCKSVPKFISVTQSVQLFEYVKDFDAIATACEAIGRKPWHEKYNRYKGKTKKQLIAEWKALTEKSLVNGNEKHDFIDDNVQKAIHNRYPSNKNIVELYTIQQAINNKDKYKLNLKELENIALRFPDIYDMILDRIKDGWQIYTEICTYNVDFGVVGMIDLFMLKYPYFMIGDWKTNKSEIDFRAGYLEKDDDGNITDKFILRDDMMQKPISHLPDSTGNHYALQLSIYTYLTSLFGLKHVGDLNIYHIRNKSIGEIDGTEAFTEYVNTVKVPYLSQEAIALMNEMRNRQIKYMMSCN